MTKNTKSSNIPLILENTFFVTLSQIMSKVFGILITFYLARKLGVVYFGKYSLAVTTAAFLAVFVDFGMSPLLIREVSKNYSLARKYLSNILILRIIITILLLMILVIVLFLTALPSSTKFFILLFAVPLLPNAFSITLNSLFNAKERLRITSLISVIFSLLNFVAIILVLRAGFGLLGVALTSISLAVLSLFVLFFFTKINFFVPSFSLDLDLCKTLLKQALPFAVIAIQTLVYFRIDIFMLAEMSTERSIGLYNASYKFIDGLLIIPAMFSTVMLPVMSRVSKDEGGVVYLCQKSIRYLLVLIFPIIVGTALIAHRLISFVYGSKYLSAAPALAVLIWTLVFISMNVPIVNMLYTRNKTASIVPIVFFMILTNFGLNLILIPKYDFIGASLATVITECLGFILLLILLEKISASLDYFALIKTLLKPILAVAIMALIISQLGGLNVIMVIFIGAIAYSGILILLRPFDELDRKILHYAVESLTKPIKARLQYGYFDGE